MSNPYRAYDGRFGLGVTVVLALIASASVWGAVTKSWWWSIVALLTTPFFFYRVSRIHSTPERRFYHHFLMLFSGNLGAEVATAKQEGREPVASNAALLAIATLLPQQTTATIVIMLAESLAQLDDDGDRNRLASTIYAKTKSPTNSPEACRQALDRFIEQNRNACTARWIAAKAVEDRWGAASRLNLLSDIVLARLTESS